MGPDAKDEDQKDKGVECKQTEKRAENESDQEGKKKEVKVPSSCLGTS